jgi:succinate dehydrogenase/fumarate reductase iron-sulfur protein
MNSVFVNMFYTLAMGDLFNFVILLVGILYIVFWFWFVGLELGIWMKIFGFFSVTNADSSLSFQEIDTGFAYRFFFVFRTVGLKHPLGSFTTYGYFAVYPLDARQCGPMILDALFLIKNRMDPTLAFRRSCREGICGSCSMNVNQYNCLACITHIYLSTEFFIVTGLPHLRVIRDLICDLSIFYNQYTAIQPWLKTFVQKRTELFQSRTDRVVLDGLYECILCACCSTSCPSYWWNGDNYLGPAILLQAFRWIIESRDQASVLRIAALEDAYKLYRCHSILNCSNACPKELNPALVIVKLKDLLQRSN